MGSEEHFYQIRRFGIELKLKANDIKIKENWSEVISRIYAIAQKYKWLDFTVGKVPVFFAISEIFPFYKLPEITLIGEEIKEVNTLRIEENQVRTLLVEGVGIKALDKEIGVQLVSRASRMSIMKLEELYQYLETIKTTTSQILSVMYDVLNTILQVNCKVIVDTYINKKFLQLRLPKIEVIEADFIPNKEVTNVYVIGIMWKDSGNNYLYLNQENGRITIRSQMEASGDPNEIISINEAKITELINVLRKNVIVG
ncbi:MAG: hypothetical protein DRJ30_03380 [Candidatus Methanomethylicota archaeon]|nr:MAG: hypothetical protein DRJ30_03380 [Candidatus Verstraetearchaeota archaeon]